MLRLEPAAPIRLADRNQAHYPSRHDFKFMLTPFFLHENVSVVQALGLGLSSVDCLPDGSSASHLKNSGE